MKYDQLKGINSSYHQQLTFVNVCDDCFVRNYVLMSWHLVAGPFSVEPRSLPTSVPQSVRRVITVSDRTLYTVTGTTKPSSDARLIQERIQKAPCFIAVSCVCLTVFTALVAIAVFWLNQESVT